MHFAGLAMNLAPPNLIILARDFLAISVTLSVGLVVIGQNYVRASHTSFILASPWPAFPERPRYAQGLESGSSLVCIGSCSQILRSGQELQDLHFAAQSRLVPGLGWYLVSVSGRTRDAGRSQDK